jgi:2-(3-amino-3-carboxypropyl)histidine synthase
VTTTEIRTLYVFVSIEYQYKHLVDTILLNFPNRDGVLYLLGTIQFSGSLAAVKACLEQEYAYRHVLIPQIKPLSPGEVLGCTAPKLTETEGNVVYVGDGRFHLESIMIQNRALAQHFYRYDPYTAKLTREQYDYQAMNTLRRDAIEQARLPQCRRYGLIIGTLGRQGNLDVVSTLKARIKAAGKSLIIILLSEISPDKLRSFGGTVDVFVQTACPRLSIDWGYAYDKPLLSPYEAVIALMTDDEYVMHRPTWMETSSPYPMDFYANDSLGPWTPNHQDPVEMARLRQERKQRLAEKLQKIKR